MIQRYLAGGDTPTDVRKKYHPLEISAWIGEGLKAVIDVMEKAGRNPGIGSLMKSYKIDLDSEQFPKITAALPIKLWLGPKHMTVLYSCDNECENWEEINYRQGGGQEVMLGYLKGATPYYTLTDNQVVLRNVQANKVLITTIPAPDAEIDDDDDDFNISGELSDQLLKWLVNYLIQKKQYASDKRNNDKIDNEPV